MSGTYAAGDRRSAGGNAYQCVTGGTSTAVPTGTGSAINNGGVAVWQWLSAVNYTSLAAFAAALPSTLTQPFVAQLWNNGSITTAFATPWLNLTGIATSAANSITIMPAPGEGFADTLAMVSGWQATPYVQVNGTTVSISSTADNFTTYPCYGSVQLVQNSYWELKVVAPADDGGGCEAGLAPLGGSATDIGPLLQWHEDGSLWSDGGFQNLGAPGTWPTYATGDTVCMAFDAVNNKVYGRKGATGNWNNSGTANPATNTGGLAVPASILAAGVVIGAIVYNNTCNITGNFASTAFVGTPPAGFGPLSGFPLAFSAATGVNFIAPATGVNNTNYITLDVPNAIFTGIQMQDPNPVSGSTLLKATQGALITRNIFDGYGQAGGADIVDGSGLGAIAGTFGFTNNLVIERMASPGTGAKTINLNYNSSLANNTIVALNSPTSAICVINQGSSAYTTNTTNNVIIGYAPGNTIGANNGATTTAQYSLFSSAILTGGVTLGSGNLYSKTAANQFVSATANFRLKSTADAVNAGTTDTTDIPSAVDILGVRRPQGITWDIGAHEYPVATTFGTSTITFTATGVSTAGTRSAGTSSITFTANAVSRSTAASGTSTITFSANAVGRSTATAVGASGITFAATGYNAGQSVNAVILIDPIPPQPANTPFRVSGTYELVPMLEFVDDSGTAYTAVPLADTSVIGTTTFEFIHPGVSSAGTQTLVMLDTSSGATGSAPFFIQPTPNATSFPPPGPTTVAGIIPSYLYEEYNDDDNLQALVASYNGLAQGYLDWFNGINLPIYTGDQISGPLLDWVGRGVYGIARPTISYTTGLPAVGPFNTYPLDSIAFDTGNRNSTTTVYTVTDDIYKRIITWQFFKGDGFTFNPRWLKRRVMRFLAGTNGIDPGVDQTYQVGVSFTGATVINITINSGTAPTTYAPVLRAAIASGVVSLPFQYSYNVLIP